MITLGKPRSAWVLLWLECQLLLAPLESFKLYGGAGFGYQNRGLASAHAAVNQGVYISSLAGFDYGLSEQVDFSLNLTLIITSVPHQPISPIPLIKATVPFIRP
ncbi:MAG: hypothetical protein R2865_15405 [Deinococcales bacterium]